MIKKLSKSNLKKPPNKNKAPIKKQMESKKHLKKIKAMIKNLLKTLRNLKIQKAAN